MCVKEEGGTEREIKEDDEEESQTRENRRRESVREGRSEQAL